VPTAATASGRAAFVLLLATAWTLGNLVKPLTVDDTAYVLFARHIAAHPFDPFGFTIFWYHQPQPAIEVLAPPVTLYWLAAAVRLFGESVAAWKLWFFPVAWLFAASVDRLASRFAPGSERLVTATVVLSPVFLPAMNLMLDVPALALALASLVAFVAAVDRGDARAALTAGVLAGLAMQTKYTAFAIPPVMLTYAVLHGRAGLALLASGVAVSVFGVWEAAVFFRYGQSVFLLSLGGERLGLASRLQLLAALVPLAGGAAGGLLPLSLVALGARRRWVLIGAGAALAAVLLVGLLPGRLSVALPSALGGAVRHPHPNRVLFTLLGLPVVALAATVAWRVRARGSLGAERRTAKFLATWLLIELAAFLAFTPFMAARRIMGLMVVAAMLVGRLAAGTLPQAGIRRSLDWVVAVNAAAGAIFYAADACDAVAQKKAAGVARALVARIDQAGGGRVWYLGHWGFQYYAERERMRAVLPGESALRKGDWLVEPDEHVDRALIAFPPGAVSLTHQIDLDDDVPWRSVPMYYRGDVPLAPVDGPRLRVRIYRVEQDVVPQLDPRVRRRPGR
jgi:hypothetical protein